MSTPRLVASALIVIGALNWGLVALASFDLVAWIAGLTFGNTNTFSRLVYGLVAIAGVFEALAIIGQLRHRQPKQA